MSVFHNPVLAGASGQAAEEYQIERSLRFNSADSAYLSKTFASAGNRKTWTIALWVKRSAFGASQTILSNDIDLGFYFDFDSGDSLRVLDYGQNAGLDIYYVTSAVYRDPSAWYHVLVSIDTTNATSADRVKIYVNGSRLTAFAASTAPALDFQTTFNSTQVNAIGRNDAGANNWHFNGYLADIHFIDGQALDPTSFGEFDANGVWQPVDASGLTYGTNGFHLDFADNSTAAALGYDAAGSNDWTVNNLSVTAGAGNDSLVDSPTNYGEDTGAGGEVRGNYCTLNPLNVLTQTLSNGNLQVSGGGVTSVMCAVGTIAMSSGKWYFEHTAGSNRDIVGIYNALVMPTAGPGVSADSYGYFGQTGQKLTNNVLTSYGATFGLGDIVAAALDLDAGTLTYYVNGVSQGTAFTGITGTYVFAVRAGNNGATSTAYVNFGQRPFAYTAPSGYKALCTQNLPTPTIEDGSTAMDVVTYTGTGSALTPTSSLNFSPDLIWIKSRSATTDHTLYDIVRGTQARLESNNTDTEVTSDNGVTAFNSNGFTLGTLAQVNTSSATYVGWCWDGGSSNATNTDGSITSTVRANASAGISIISYTGTGTAGTIGHGLGVTPGMVIVKGRGSTGTSDAWATYMTGASATAGAYLLLEKTSAVATSSVVFNGTNPTSSVFSVGTWDGSNKSGIAFIAYAFAPVSGFSAFGKYTGNGSADGPFVYTGFRPAFVLVKMSSSTGNWTILDSIREGYNVDNDPLYPNLINAEGTTDLADITSNGFKVRTTDATFNTNAGTYVYACFAENPFSLARAR